MSWHCRLSAAVLLFGAVGPLRAQAVSPQPPEPVWPTKGAVVTDSFPLFVWNRPVTPAYAGDCFYSIRVAEMGPGQTSLQATESEATIVQHCRSSCPAWRYRSISRNLVPGKTYAWRVEA